MSARTLTDAEDRLYRHDPSLMVIYLVDKHHTDKQVAELVDFLLAHPDVVMQVSLNKNRLTDETGIKLARYLATSSRLMWLDLRDNLFGEATFLALAAALRANSSLQELYLYWNRAVDSTRIDAAFIEALQMNPNRSPESKWQLYSYGSSDIDFKRLKDKVKQTHPTLQMLLVLIS